MRLAKRRVDGEWGLRARGVVILGAYCDGTMTEWQVDFTNCKGPAMKNLMPTMGNIPKEGK